MCDPSSYVGPSSYSSFKNTWAGGRGGQLHNRKTGIYISHQHANLKSPWPRWIKKYKFLQHSHFWAVAQAKLLLIQEESAWAKTLQSPKYFAKSKYGNYSPTTEQHQPLGGMQELFNSAQKHLPKVLDRSWRFLNAQLKLQQEERTGPLPYLGPGWKGEHHPPSTTPLPPGHREIFLELTHLPQSSTWDLAS